jgi:hypothetical protein
VKGKGSYDYFTDFFFLEIVSINFPYSNSETHSKPIFLFPVPIVLPTPKPLLGYR